MPDCVGAGGATVARVELDGLTEVVDEIGVLFIDVEEIRLEVEVGRTTVLLLPRTVATQYDALAHRFVQSLSN